MNHSHSLLTRVTVLTTVLLTATSLVDSACAQENGSNKPAQIYCYTDRLSYKPGDSASFHVSTTAPRYSIRIARVGRVRQTVWEKSGLKGRYYPTPKTAYADGCNWPQAFTLKIPATWKSGYYSIVVMAEGTPGQRAQWEHFFVVRSAHPGRDAKILMVLSTNTYHAYNYWGGKNMYEGAVKAAIQRPFARGFLSKPNVATEGRIADLDEPNEGFEPDFLRYLQKHGFKMWTGAAGWAQWEHLFVQWAEREGYQIDYAINSDLERHPEILNGYKLYLSVGHDEYWSWKMRDTLENWIKRGGNAAFFTGNSVYWQVRFENDGKHMVCYKYDNQKKDPVYGTKKQHLLTVVWSDRRIGRPENSLIGLSFHYGGYARIAGATPRSSGGYKVYRDDHWVFANTDLRYGDQFGTKDKIVAYEVDGCDYTVKDGLPYPTGKDGTPKNLQILAMAPASLWSKERTPQQFMGSIPDAEVAALAITGDRKNYKRFVYNVAVMGIYTRGGTVFNAGSTDWVYGLHGGDAKVEQITRNVLDRLSK